MAELDLDAHSQKFEGRVSVWRSYQYCYPTTRKRAGLLVFTSGLFFTSTTTLNCSFSRVINCFNVINIIFSDDTTQWTLESRGLRLSGRAEPSRLTPPLASKGLLWNTDADHDADPLQTPQQLEQPPEDMLSPLTLDVKSWK